MLIKYFPPNIGFWTIKKIKTLELLSILKMNVSLNFFYHLRPEQLKFIILPISHILQRSALQYNSFI